MKVISRLKRMAQIEDLSEKNIPHNIINQVLQSENSGVASSEVVFRKLMNSNTRFVVEIWSLDDGTFGVFSGYFEGNWTPDMIEHHEDFSSVDEAQLFVQNNLQSQAESKENLMASKSKVNVREMMASGKEPDYNEIANGFLETVNIKGAQDVNGYYQEWKNYMNRYYPEWAAYPAYIWRGWGYFTNLVEGKDEDPKNEDSKEDNNNVEQETTIDNTPTNSAPVIDSAPMGDMGGGEF